MAKRNKPQKQRQIMLCAIAALAALLVVGLITLWLLPSRPASKVELPEETLPTNAYDEAAFYQSDGYLHYAGGDNRLGIDVSAHQGLIDWAKVRDAGIEFAVIRAGYRGSTEGRLYEDEQFRYNIEGAQTVGLSVGIYFYSQAISEEEAVEEAQYVCSLLQDYSPELPVFYDWEHGDGSGRTSDASSHEITDYAIAFCEEIKRSGYQTGVYFNLSYAYHELEMSRLQDYTLWLAEYNFPPTYPYRFDWLQYSATGSVPGIETTVDLDLMLLPKEEAKDFVVINETTAN